MRWPSGSAKGRAALYRVLQDLDVYVEDTNAGAQTFYQALFQRIIPKGIRLQRVIEAGNKSEVIRLCTSHDFSRPALFIVDGDFEWVRGDVCPNLPGLFRLSAYCIENLLLDERSVVDCAFDLDGVKSRRQIEQDLALRSWLSSLEDSLEDLSVWFAVSNQLLPELITVGRGIGAIVKQARKDTLLDDGKIKSICEEIKTELSKSADATSVKSSESKVRRRIKKSKNRLHFISGKDFVLPLLRFHLRAKAHDYGSYESFRLRLAMRCSLRKFSALRRAIREAVQ